MRLNRKWLALAAPAIFLFPIAFSQLGQAQAPAASALPAPKVPLGLIPFAWPKDNPYSAGKVELGKLLYYDKRLSADNTVACATCHAPETGFTDAAPVSTGIRGQKGGRSAPTVLNRAYSLAQFWDGRAASLEDQAKGPIQNPIEMGNTHEAVVAKLRGIAGYRPLFKRVFGTEELTIDHVAMAIASYERTVLSGNSPYDRYKAGQKNALSAAQVRGMGVYFDKAKCDQCHEGVNLTLNSYHNIGVGTDKANPDIGRMEVTKNTADWGSFKTPTLRDIARTAPYMHDGSVKTLEDVVEYYDKGGTPNKNLDERIKPLKLTAQEKKDLADFMRAFNGEGWQAQHKAPVKFPQ